MTQLVLLSASEARRITDEVKADAAALWSKLLRLYEGDAHITLGYSSWSSYYEAEFGQSGMRGHQLLQAARTLRTLEPVNNCLPQSEGVAREFIPLQDEPDLMREAWQEAVAEHGPQPTAAEVREHVEPRRNGSMGVHYSSATDEWATPPEFFAAVDAEFGFELDVCALPASSKCERYLTPEQDGLSVEWDGVCWMNPPYGDEIGKWVKKAHDSALDGATVVCLVPARVDTGWWWDYCRFGEIRFLRGRLKFGDSGTSAPFPSALVVFGRPACVKWWEWR